MQMESSTLDQIRTLEATRNTHSRPKADDARTPLELETKDSEGRLRGNLEAVRSTHSNTCDRRQREHYCLRWVEICLLTHLSI